MKKWMTGLTLASVSVVSNTSLANSPEELTVYTAFETDLLSTFEEAFEKEHPNITINWVRDSTGVITARILAEGKGTPADVVWGLAASSQALLKNQGIIKAYTPEGVSELKSGMVDPESDKAWYGHDAFFNAICFNSVEAEKLGLPKPEKWDDLLNPVYKGHIIMPNPASSGTGYTQVAAWLQTMGEEKGWAYMEALDKNIAKYTHSGSKPCVEAAQGETVIGISFALRGAKLKTQGAPIDLVMPQGVGWDLEAVGLVNTSSDAAKALADWSVSEEANELYNTVYPVVAHKDVKGEVKNYPDVEAVMADVDFGRMANERDAVLKEWSAKFEFKSE